jgi:hypothetical protein
LVENQLCSLLFFSTKIQETLLFIFFGYFIFDVICGQSLVGSNPRGPPVFQALLPCQISSQYLFWLSSSGSDTIEKLKFLPILTNKNPISANFEQKR